jgi:serine/threonine protein kinase
MAKDSAVELRNVLHDYWVGDRLGIGARSSIYEVKRRRDGELFAVKFVPVRGPQDLQVVGHLENEYRVLTAMQEVQTSGIHVAVRAIEFKKIRRLFKVTAAYLIMERLRGLPLSERRDYDLDSVLVVFRQVCMGIENAHRAGYVHADLKPQNILVGEHLDVKLIDFGFAAPTGTRLTSFKGTFGYIAPEQAAGIVTERTDVFNLGAALYWVLTGQNLPSIMPGEHEALGFIPDQQVAITPPCEFNADVPRELSDFVLKCLSYKESDRPTVTQLKRYMHGLQLRMELGAV